MTRAYIRLDPAFDERKESYPDGPYAALIATFCLAEHQPERGRFRSLDYLRRLLGHRGRHLSFLATHGDVTELPDGRVYVDGWDEWQEGDWKVAERVNRIRHRPRGTPPVTPKVTPPVTVGVTANPAAVTVASPSTTETHRLDSGAMSGGGAMSAGNPPPDAWDAPETPVVQWLAEHGCYVAPSSGYRRNLITAVERHGPDAIIAAMERLAKAGQRNGDVKGFVFGAIDALDKEARPAVLELVRSDVAQQAAERTRRNVERTKRHLHDIGHHQDAPDPLCPACKERTA